MTELASNDFNYGCVDAETAGKLEYYAKAGKALIRKSQIQFIADFGKILSEANDVLASHDKTKGKFIRWATSEFDISKDTVYRYLNAWERILSHSATTYLHWSASALYLLASDDVPKPVLKKLEKLPSTDLVRVSDVRRIIEAAKPKQPKPEEVPFDAAEPDEPDETEWPSEPADAPAADAIPEQVQAAEDPPVIDKDKQAKAIRSAIQQHIDKAVRLCDDLHGVAPNHKARTTAIVALQGIRLW